MSDFRWDRRVSAKLVASLVRGDRRLRLSLWPPRYTLDEGCLSPPLPPPSGDTLWTRGGGSAPSIDRPRDRRCTLDEGCGWGSSPIESPVGGAQATPQRKRRWILRESAKRRSECRRTGLTPVSSVARTGGLHSIRGQNRQDATSGSRGI